MDYIELVNIGEEAIFWIMGIMSMIAVAVAVERTIVFMLNTSKGESVVKEIQTSIRNKDLNGLSEKLSKYKRNIFARFTKFGIEQYPYGEHNLSELLAGKIIEERIQLEKRLPILSTLGNNAPFIGLLGTVLGVIKAFNNLGTLGNSGAEVVMKSISTALLATAAGLLVAIPVVMTNNFFTKKVKVIIQNLEIITREFLASYHKK